MRCMRKRNRRTEERQEPGRVKENEEPGGVERREADRGRRPFGPPPGP